MADETVEIDVNIDVNTEEAGGKFVRLQTQIRETRTALQQAAEAGDKLRFGQLKDQLDDLEDSLEKTTLQSKKFDDALASAPGPIGAVGGALKGLDGAFKFLMANPYVAIIAGIAGALLAMKKSLESTAEGQETLNRLSKAFSSVLGPILATIESVAVPLFNGFAFVLEKVGEGFAYVAEKMGISSRKIAEASTQGNKEFYDAAQRDLDNMAKVQAILKDQENQRIQATKQARADAQAELKRLTEEDKKAFTDLIETYNRELDEYYKRKKQLQGVQIITQKELRAMDAAEAEEAAKKKKEEDDKRIAEQQKVMSTMTNYTLLALQKQFGAQKKVAEDTDKLGKWLNSEEKKRLDEKIQAIEATLQIVAGLVDEQSVAGKAVAVALTLIDTYQSATAAYKAVVGIPVVGPTLAPIAAAAAIAAGLATVKKIVSTKVPSAKGEGQAAGSSGAGGASTPAFSQPNIAAPQIGATANQQGQLAGIVAGALDRNNSVGQPIRAYVIGQDITSEQQLQRRIRTAARLGG
jgi:hypothetical protein